MIPLLPKWILSSRRPSFYDTESATTIEMIGKIYGSMNELIDDYNKFVDNTNQIISDFNESTTKDIELFKVAMRQEFQDFIDVVELKIKSQDEYIESTVVYIKDNLETSIKAILTEIKENGTFEEWTREVLNNLINEVANAIANMELEIDTAIANLTNKVDEKLEEVDKVLDVAEALTEIGKSYDLIWENQSPNENFVTQTLELGNDVISKYDEFCISYKSNKTGQNDSGYIILKNRSNREGEYVTGSEGAYVNTGMYEFVVINSEVIPVRRLVMVNGDVTGIYFADVISVISDDINDYNSHLIPCKIYGIKQNVLNSGLTADEQMQLENNTNDIAELSLAIEENASAIEELNSNALTKADFTLDGTTLTLNWL